MKKFFRMINLQIVALLAILASLSILFLKQRNLSIKSQLEMEEITALKIKLKTIQKHYERIIIDKDILEAKIVSDLLIEHLNETETYAVQTTRILTQFQDNLKNCECYKKNTPNVSIIKPKQKNNKKLRV